MIDLKSLPFSVQPVNKLLERGPQCLADVELLAVLLRFGCDGMDVLNMAQMLVDEFGGLAGVLIADPAKLASIKGMGSSKVAALLSVRELASRAIAQQLKEREVFRDPSAVRQYFQLNIGHLSHEVFTVLFLDLQNRMIAMEVMFRGTMNQTSVYPREVALRALHHGAACVVLCHNHPSGSVHPSRADEHLTQTLKAALALVDVRVLDHIIVGQGQCLSMAEKGLM